MKNSISRFKSRSEQVCKLRSPPHQDDQCYQLFLKAHLYHHGDYFTKMFSVKLEIVYTLFLLFKTIVHTYNTFWSTPTPTPSPPSLTMSISCWSVSGSPFTAKRSLLWRLRNALICGCKDKYSRGSLTWNDNSRFSFGACELPSHRFLA